DPGVIRLSFDGADSLSLDADGNLVLATPLGDVVQQAPLVYQTVDGSREPVSGKFVLLGHDEVGFQLGAYDASLPLTIDPALGYSTRFPGFGPAGSVTVDSAGCAY